MCLSSQSGVNIFYSRDLFVPLTPVNSITVCKTTVVVRFTVQPVRVAWKPTLTRSWWAPQTLSVASALSTAYCLLVLGKSGVINCELWSSSYINSCMKRCHHTRRCMAASGFRCLPVGEQPVYNPGARLTSFGRRHSPASLRKHLPQRDGTWGWW